MKNIKIKLQYIFLPFLLVSIGTIVSYTAFRWFFDIKLGILPLKENLLNLWIPITVAGILVYVFLRRKVKILNLRGKRDDGHFVYVFVMAFATGIPLMMSQQYLVKSAYKLQEVSSIAEIQNLQNEKYFTIPAFQVNKYASLSHVNSRVSGRNNENLNFHLYLSCPFKFVDNVWYGVEYSRSIKNSGTEQKKNSAYRIFIRSSEEKFNKYNFQDVRYFEKLGYSDDKDGFLNAIKEQYPDKNLKEQIILIPKKEAFSERLGNTFPWIFGAYGIGVFVLLIMILIPKIDEEEWKRFQQKKPLRDDDVKDILKFLNPTGVYKASAILILLNIGVFLVMVLYGLNLMSPTPQELLEIGGNRRTEVLNGEYWRLFSATFIHGGLLHLGMNMVGLAFLGMLLEHFVGAVKLIVIYVTCGILASLASIYWYENTVGVGASGAIYGLNGLLLAFLVFKVYPKYERSAAWIVLGLFGGIGLLFGIFSGGIDNAAHFGGLFSGFVIGAILVLLYKKQFTKK
ncbi:rhomboid protease AarA [Kordia sp. SMS9]|uniref:rhomboid family intramembrane serine protease n=1 Tax=Kordia sp. SMS9 TaxID=2282170 RepID=UPI000E10350C|nr:rhomboid family intramembrane serine protease [Kordia sp. SMS9]AXG69714.1 rhomboid protease AarA [Kordia sp. SMS9]